MAQQESGMARLAPYTGAVAVVLAVVGGGLGFGGVEWLAPGEEIAAHLAESSGRVWIGTILTVLSAPFLLWFLGSLWRRMRAAEGDPARLSVVMFGGGVTAAAAMVAGGAVWSAAAARVDDAGSIDPVYAALSYDLGALMWGLAAPIGLAVVLLSFAVLSIRAATHPAWWGWLSGAIGVVLLVPPIAWAAMLAGLLWILVMSIWLGVEGARTA